MKPLAPFVATIFWLFALSMELPGQVPGEILFQTEGVTFNPLIQLNGTATVLWTFADGTTSTELHPYKEYGNASTRINKLSVVPWSALKMINIGYDASDSGSWEIPYVPNQYVSGVDNLSLVQNNLETWCSSYNLLDTIIFDNFTALQTVECFMSQTLRHVSLTNTPALSRLCVEDANLTALDVSDCISLMDLRGAFNNFQNIQFADTSDALWHICIRDNPQITNDSMFDQMNRFPGIAELFIWNTNQYGTFRMSQNHPTRNISILADGNHYSALDLRGSLQDENGSATVSFAWNGIQSADFSGCDQIRQLYLQGNWMSQDTVDKVLRQLDESETLNGSVNLTGNANPSLEGMVSKANLESKGWIVEVNYFPDINVVGNGVSIADGDFTPSLSDSTNFGIVNIGDTIKRQFIIQNQGNTILNGWGDPPNVSIYGPDAQYFHIADSVHFPIGFFSSDTLTISFTPDAKRGYSAEIFITHEDYDEAPFNFAIKATGKIDNGAVIAANQGITDEILFLSEGASFSPLIQLNRPAEVVWTFADSTTSASLNPVKEYGSAASRMNRLKVTPWDALEMINIGFDGSDGGWWLPYVPDQHISYLQNTGLAKDSLRYWCSSFNLLDSLILDDFVNLEAVECFQSQTVTKVSLHNTPKLRRLCLEDNDLSNFDISGSPALEDIRGALNNYPTINFSDSTQAIWHICVRDNQQITNDSLFADLAPFPNIAELFIWNTNQAGKFRMAQNHPLRNISILADGNHYSAVDLRGSLQNENGYAEVFFAGNQVHSVDIEGCDQIRRLGLAWNGMPADTVDKVLQQLDAFGTSNGIVYLGDNEMPGPAGLACKQNLENRGWEVNISGPVITTYGNGNIIYNGDTTPSIADFTQFDTTRIGLPVSHEFVIRNQGNYPLHLSGSPVVSVSGPGAGNFTVTMQPDSTIAPWWSSSNFTITFSPQSPGTHSATISIIHDAVNTSSPFTFTIRGTGDARISDTLISPGDSVCFGSETILTLAGDGNPVQFENGSAGNLIAVQAIYLQPGFLASTGCAVHAWISPDSNLCETAIPLNPGKSLTLSSAYQAEPEETQSDLFIKVYPNPNEGTFTVQFINAAGPAEVTVLNISGKKVYSRLVSDCTKSTLLRTNLERGLYLIRVSSSGKLMTGKLLVN